MDTGGKKCSFPIIHSKTISREQDTSAHHFLKGERFLCDGESIFAAKIPENGISHHQLQSGGAQPDNQLCQNHWGQICGTI